MTKTKTYFQRNTNSSILPPLHSPSFLHILPSPLALPGSLGQWYCIHLGNTRTLNPFSCISGLTPLPFSSSIILEWENLTWVEFGLLPDLFASSLLSSLYIHNPLPNGALRAPSNFHTARTLLDHLLLFLLKCPTHTPPSQLMSK